MADFSSKNNFYSDSKSNTEEYSNLIKKIRERNLKTHKLKDFVFSVSKKTKIDDEIANREKIKNEGLKQDIALKRGMLQVLCYLLVIETIIVFLFSFFQAIEQPWGFRLDEWSFKLLITATISQITIMLLVAVQHLFPNQK